MSVSGDPPAARRRRAEALRSVRERRRAHESEGRLRPGEPEGRDDGNEGVGELRTTLGQRILDLRRQRQLTVTALAAAAGVTPGFISQVERGQALPSIATLVRIAAALSARVGDLFDAPPPTGRVLRRAERVGYEYPNSGLRDEVISADPDGRLEVLVAYLAPGGGTGPELYAHGAKSEFVVVLKGRIELWLGDESYVLEEGDTLTFPGTIPHGYINRWDETAELLWAMTPACY